MCEKDGAGWPAELVVEAERGLELASPAHPALYPALASFHTTITAPPGHNIVIEWGAFNVEQSQDCKYDRLVIQQVNF